MLVRKFKQTRRKNRTTRRITNIRRRRYTTNFKRRQVGGIKLADKFSNDIDQSKKPSKKKSQLITNEICDIGTDAERAYINCKQGQTSTHGRSILGDFNSTHKLQDRKFNGNGMFLWNNDPHYKVYQGEWLDNKIHGEGHMTWSDGTTFHGNFVGDKLVNGIVVYKTRNKQLGRIAIKGELEVDKSEIGSKGEIQLWNGRIVTSYEGSIKDGTPHGRGKIIFNDDQDKDEIFLSYDGEINDGKMEGKGILYLDDNEVYIGNFVDNNKHGRGIYKEYDKDHINEEAEIISEQNWNNGSEDGTWYEWDKIHNTIFRVDYKPSYRTININSDSTKEELDAAIKYVSDPEFNSKLKEIRDEHIRQNNIKDIIEHSRRIQNPKKSRNRRRSPAKNQILLQKSTNFESSSSRDVSPVSPTSPPTSPTAQMKALRELMDDVPST